MRCGFFSPMRFALAQARHALGPAAPASPGGDAPLQILARPMGHVFGLSRGAANVAAVLAARNADGAHERRSSRICWACRSRAARCAGVAARA